jgi:hypothetical protein
MRDLSSGETEVGKVGADGARIAAVLCTIVTISSMLSSFSSAVYLTLTSQMPGYDSWTHLHGFDALRHSGDGSLWAPYRASIEALLRQVENSAERAHNLRASLIVLACLITPNESTIMSK